MLPRLGAEADVEFLVDTGADITILSAVDAGYRLAVDYSRLTTTTPTYGIGGTSDLYEETGLLILPDDTGVLYVLEVSLALMQPDSESLQLPYSLLGRDVLARGSLEHVPAAGRLRFDIESWDGLVPIST